MTLKSADLGADVRRGRPEPVAIGSIALAAGLAAALVVSGCATSTQASPAAPPSSVATPAPTATKGALTKHSAKNKSIPAPQELVPSPSVSASRVADPLAPKELSKVLRGAKKPTPAVKAKPARIGEPVTYSDGLDVSITKVTQSTVKAEGPGNFTGSPITTLRIQLTNGTTKAISLNQVVMTAQYGSPARVAPATYGPGSEDFSGTVKPGAKASASYTVSIPVADVCEVSVTVDFDGLHSSADFDGAATAAAVRARGFLGVC